MCGINGFNWSDRSLVQRMNKTAGHRGPDNSAVFVDDGISLGHLRLSIIDLSDAANQPMTNEDGTVVLVYNGEIYNFKDLRSGLEKGHRFVSATDTEVIVHGYEEWGMEGLLSRLNGIFAFALWDSGKKRLFLVRDHMGVKPLYYFFDGSRLVFSSEIKSILEAPVERKVCMESMARFLMFRYNASEETLIEGVKKVMPGSFVTYDAKSHTLGKIRYWQISHPSKPVDKSESFFVKRLRKLLDDSVEMQLVSDVPLGVYLSGGLDSTTIVALMADRGHENIRTYSVGFGDDARNRDVSFASRVSEHFGTAHSEIFVDQKNVVKFPRIIWHMDEPLADPAIVPTFFLSEGVNRDATVVLNGAGGDELFLGYQHYKILKARSHLSRIPRWLVSGATAFAFGDLGRPLRRIHPYFYSFGAAGGKRLVEAADNSKDPASFYLKIVQMFTGRELDEVLAQGSQGRKFADIFAKDYKKRYFSSDVPYLNQVSRLESENFLVDDVLMLTDKMTMAHHLEARVPLLDRRIVRLCMMMPPGKKMRGFDEKYVLKKAVKDIVPKFVINRKKQGYFVPIDQWFGSDFKGVIVDRVLEGGATEAGLFSKSILQKRIVDNLKDGSLYYSRQAWNVFTFNVWYDTFIAGRNYMRNL